MWDGVLDGTAPRSKCPQPEDLSTVTSNMVGEEDCLYLNVFTPDVRNVRIIRIFIEVSTTGIKLWTL